MRFSILMAAVAAGLLLPAGPAAAWAWPTGGPVLKPFALGNDPYAGGQHRGIDVGAEAGDDVLAPAAGTVTFSGSVPGRGRTVTIETAGGLSVTLVHLSGLSVRRGDEVREGAAVGVAGITPDGEWPRPYVHLGVRRAADRHGYLDPLTLLPPRSTPVPAVAPAAPPPAAKPAPEPAAPQSGGVPAPKPPTVPAAAPVPAPPRVVPASTGPTVSAQLAPVEPARASAPAAGPPPAATPAASEVPAAATGVHESTGEPAPAPPPATVAPPVAPAPEGGVAVDLGDRVEVAEGRTPRKPAGPSTETGVLVARVAGSVSPVQGTLRVSPAWPPGSSVGVVAESREPGGLPWVAAVRSVVLRADRRAGAGRLVPVPPATRQGASASRSAVPESPPAAGPAKAGAPVGRGPGTVAGLLLLATALAAGLLHAIRRRARPVVTTRDEPPRTAPQARVTTPRAVGAVCATRSRRRPVGRRLCVTPTHADPLAALLAKPRPRPGPTPAFRGRQGRAVARAHAVRSRRRAVTA